MNSGRGTLHPSADSDVTGFRAVAGYQRVAALAGCWGEFPSVTHDFAGQEAGAVVPGRPRRAAWGPWVLPVLVIEPCTRQAPEECSEGTKPPKDPMLLPVNRCQSPIPTTRAVGARVREALFRDLPGDSQTRQRRAHQVELGLSRSPNPSAYGRSVVRSSRPCSDRRRRLRSNGRGKARESRAPHLAIS